MKREVLLRPEAEADIDATADFTIARWGSAQAQTYVAALRNDIASLAQFPLRYPAHRSTEFRKMISGQHLVFYLVGAESIDVVRIVHVSRDVDTQLG